MEILEYSPSFLKIFSHFVSRNYRGKLAPEFRCRFAKRAVEREASRKQGKKGGLFMLIRRLVVEAVHMDCLSQVEGGAMGQDRVASWAAQTGNTMKNCDERCQSVCSLSLESFHNNSEFTSNTWVANWGDDGKWIVHLHLQCAGEDSSLRHRGGRRRWCWAQDTVVRRGQWVSVVYGVVLYRDDDHQGPIFQTLGNWFWRIKIDGLFRL